MRWDGSICPLGLKQGCFKTITYRHQGGIVWIGHVFECVQLVQVWTEWLYTHAIESPWAGPTTAKKISTRRKAGILMLRWGLTSWDGCRMQWAWSCIALNKASWQYIPWLLPIVLRIFVWLPFHSLIDRFFKRIHPAHRWSFQELGCFLPFRLKW